MRRLTVGAAVLDQTPLSWRENLANVLGAVEEARAAGVAVLCLPELCLTGYGCEDAFLAPGVADRAWRSIEELAPATGGLAVTVGLPLVFRGGLFNATAFLVDGRLEGLVGKGHLAGDGLHYEPRWFKPWPAGVAVELVTSLGVVALGDVFFQLGDVGVGFEICEDAWVGDRPGARLARRGVDLVLNPSASHFAFGKQEIRRRYVLEGSRGFGVAYVSSNLVGNEAGRAIYDGGVLIANGGALVAEGPRLSMRRRVLTVADVDLDLGRLARVRLASHRPEVGDDGERRVVVAWTPPAPPFRSQPAARPCEWELGGQRKAQELARAVALGLWGYLRKSRSRGFVVSLSGGADSSAVATLVAMMVRFAWHELGATTVVDELAALGLDVRGCDTPRQVVGRLLTTVYQATRNSSETTRSAAAAVAAALGTRHLELDVDPLVEGYVAAIEGAIGRKLSWATDDVALQNIQARVRAPSVWLLANLDQALLLSTSNRSEAAVGYATMDGDTAGGLSPIAGIDKAFLLEWLRWVEREGPAELGPLPALAAVNVQSPTAELRPAGSGQTDESDLMPYPVLDAIERLAVRDKQMPAEILEQLVVRWPEVERPVMASWVVRFFRLWSRNQWKRERYAPSFHLDDESLDPRTWCRFPILSGGFAEELEMLATVTPSDPG